MNIFRVNRITIIVFLIINLSGCEKSSEPFGVDNNPDEWKTQHLEATGVGYLNFEAPKAARRAYALREARYDAIDKVTNSLRFLMLYSGISLGEWMDMNPEKKQEIETKIRGFSRISDTRYEDDRIEVDVFLELSGIYELIYEDHEEYSQAEP